MSLNVRHSILQLLLTRSFLTNEEFTNLLTPFDLNPVQFITDSQELLRPLGFELRQIISDYTNIEYVGICLMTEDSNASECLGLKASVVQIFFTFLESVINSEEKAVSTIPIGFLFEKCENVSMSQIQESLDNLAEQGFIEIHENQIRIGPRGLLEFRPVFSKLVSTDSGSLQKCPICLDFVLAGKKCSQCECYCHRRCKDTIEGICPVCRSREPFLDFGM